MAVMLTQCLFFTFVINFNFNWQTVLRVSGCKKKIVFCFLASRTHNREYYRIMNFFNLIIHTILSKLLLSL